MTHHKRGHFHFVKPQRRPPRPAKPRNAGGGEWFFIDFWLWYQLTNSSAGLTADLWFMWFALSPDFNPPDVQLNIDNLVAVNVNFTGDPQQEQGAFSATPSGLAGSDSHLDLQHSAASVTVSGGRPTLNSSNIRIVGAGTTVADSGTITLGGSGVQGQASLLIEYAGDLFSTAGTWSLVALFPLSWVQV